MVKNLLKLVGLCLCLLLVGYGVFTWFNVPRYDVDDIEPAANLAPLYEYTWVPWTQPTWDNTWTNEHGTITRTDCILTVNAWSAFNVGSYLRSVGNGSFSGSTSIALTLNYSIRVSAIRARFDSSNWPPVLSVHCGETNVLIATLPRTQHESVSSLTLDNPSELSSMRFTIQNSIGVISLRYIAITAERLTENPPRNVGAPPMSGTGFTNGRISLNGGVTWLTQNDEIPQIQNRGTVLVQVTRLPGYGINPTIEIHGGGSAIIEERSESPASVFTWVVSNITRDIIAFTFSGFVDDIDHSPPGNGSGSNNNQPPDNDPEGIPTVWLIRAGFGAAAIALFAILLVVILRPNKSRKK